MALARGSSACDQDPVSNPGASFQWVKVSRLTLFSWAFNPKRRLFQGRAASKQGYFYPGIDPAAIGACPCHQIPRRVRPLLPSYSFPSCCLEREEMELSVYLFPKR
jgi:hypothetical protein